MDRKGYIRVMKAIVNLIVVIMIEVGKVPIESAQKIGQNIMKATTGETGKDKE